MKLHKLPSDGAGRALRESWRGGGWPLCVGMKGRGGTTRGESWDPVPAAAGGLSADQITDCRAADPQALTLLWL
jgi:hypothetical protein